MPDRRNARPPDNNQFAVFRQRPRGLANEILEVISNRMGDRDRRGRNEATILMWGNRPCTEMIPWRYPVNHWRDPCPNNRRGLPRDYPRGIDTCREQGCNPLLAPPGPPMTRRGRPGERYVCEDHKDDAEQYWRLDRFIEALRVGTCGVHKDQFLRRHPNGLNTCTCRNLTDRWQCRRCFEDKLLTLRANFCRRVSPDVRGNADPYLYQARHFGHRWEEMRKMLTKWHPCHHRCGRKRSDQTAVMGKNALSIFDGRANAKHNRLSELRRHDH